MEKINVAELLKDCPKGMELDCTMFDEILEFDYIDKDSEEYPIICRVKTEWGYNTHSFTEYGYFLKEKYSKCVIFPKGKTTWEGFQRPFKDGDVVAFDIEEDSQLFIFKEYIHNHDYAKGAKCYMMLNCDGELHLAGGDYYVERFATEEEKERLFDALKANGYKWNPETKTLEKLVEPKFKVGEVGDKIVKKNSVCVPILITKVSDEFYYSNTESSVGVLSILEQDDYELVPNKFDITTLKPFESRVLIRDNKLQKWSPAIWGYYDSDHQDYQYKLVGVIARYCIPYEGNEHLLGKTDDCSEYFKTWEN